MITMNTKPPIPPNSSFYPPTLLNFPRIPIPTNSMNNESMFTSNSTFMPAQAFVQADHNSAFYPAGNVIVSNPSANQQALPWRNFPGWTFDQLSVYPYGTGYSSLDVRRKNATRESTSTLKAWLYEHIKNPYPTKAEKIMLAIITKMTLTQVSTWFANARRRLKKENKMQWSPRNRTGDDDDDDDDKNSDNDESDTSRHRAMVDDLLDDEGDIIVDGVADETPENMPIHTSLSKSPLEASGEIQKDGYPCRDAIFKTSHSINNALHQKHHQTNTHHHLYFNPQNPNRHISFPSFRPSLRTFSSLQQSFNFINKSFMPRFKSSDDDKESNNPNNVMQGSSGKVNSEIRASTPKRTQSNEATVTEVDKKPTKPRIWCLADVATSTTNNKDKENNNSGNSNTDSVEFKNHSINVMRQANIHQALVQFYHPYFSHMNPLRIGDKSTHQRSETYDAMMNGPASIRRSPDRIGEEKSGNTFQPWLTLNERFNQERINHRNSSPLLRTLSTHSRDSDNNTTPHSSPDVMTTFKSKYSRDAKISDDVTSEASKSSLSNSSSPASNLPVRRMSPSLSPPKTFAIISPPPPSSSSSSLAKSSSSSSSSSSILSSTAATKSLSSSLLFQAPLSSDVIISAPQSPLAYRKHSPSRDSTFEYWPAGRLVDK